MVPFAADAKLLGPPRGGRKERRVDHPVKGREFNRKFRRGRSRPAPRGRQKDP